MRVKLKIAPPVLTPSSRKSTRFHRSLRWLFPVLLVTCVLVGCGSEPPATTDEPEAIAQAEGAAEPTATEAEVEAERATARATDTATAEPTATATATATRTPRPTATNTPTATFTPSATPTETPTETPIPTNTPIPTATPLPTATPWNTPNAAGDIIHIVSAGETIVTIARQYGVLSTQLTAYNSIPAEVTPGQVIRIPVGMLGQNYTAGGGNNVATPIASGASETRVVLGPVTFDWQKLNNCGPTTASVILSYYGIERPQLTIAAALKPNGNDKNVSPSEIASYARNLGMGAFVGVNGNIDLLERLVAAGYPVMVEQWMQYDGGVGHYRAVRGYDRNAQQILQEDTFLGPQIWRDYSAFNQDWAYFNNTYIVIYPTGDEATVSAIIGNDWSASAMWQRALDSYRNGSGAFALYGQAEALHQLGNSEAAIPVYEQAIAAGLPWRYLWYRYGYFEALNRTGRYARTLEVTAPVLESMGYSEDIRYHRAVAQRALGNIEEARRELNLALGDNANYWPASNLLNQLPPPPPPPTPTLDPTLATPTPDPAVPTPTLDPGIPTPTVDPALVTPTPEGGVPEPPPAEPPPAEPPPAEPPPAEPPPAEPPPAEPPPAEPTPGG